MIIARFIGRVPVDRRSCSPSLASSPSSAGRQDAQQEGHLHRHVSSSRARCSSWTPCSPNVRRPGSGPEPDPPAGPAHPDRPVDPRPGRAPAGLRTAPPRQKGAPRCRTPGRSNGHRRAAGVHPARGGPVRVGTPAESAAPGLWLWPYELRVDSATTGSGRATVPVRAALPLVGAGAALGQLDQVLAEAVRAGEPELSLEAPAELWRGSARRPAGTHLRHAGQRGPPGTACHPGSRPAGAAPDRPGPLIGTVLGPGTRRSPAPGWRWPAPSCHPYRPARALPVPRRTRGRRLGLRVPGRGEPSPRLISPMTTGHRPLRLRRRTATTRPAPTADPARSEELTCPATSPPASTSRRCPAAPVRSGRSAPAPPASSAPPRTAPPACDEAVAVNNWSEFLRIFADGEHPGHPTGPGRLRLLRQRRRPLLRGQRRRGRADRRQPASAAAACTCWRPSTRSPSWPRPGTPTPASHEALLSTAS